MTIPGLSGLEVLREVRRIRPGIHVILTSAYSLDMLRLPPDAPAISGFIRKPFQLSELLRFLQNALRKETITRAAG
jgi:CheY-like chemotaxis protein